MTYAHDVRTHVIISAPTLDPSRPQHPLYARSASRWSWSDAEPRTAFHSASSKPSRAGV